MAVGGDSLSFNDASSEELRIFPAGAGRAVDNVARLCGFRLTGRPTLDESLAIALVVVGVIAAGGLVGLALQRILPERYTMDKARDMIGGVVGQLTLLLVLVNGLLIWTAYGVYSTQQTELQTLAARALEFDLEMRQYGPRGGRRPQHPEDSISSGRTSSSGATTTRAPRPTRPPTRRWAI